MSPLVAEVYGLDYGGPDRRRQGAARDLRATADIVGVDNSVEYPSEKGVVLVDRAKASRLGLSQAAVVDALGIGSAARTRLPARREPQVRGADRVLRRGRPCRSVAGAGARVRSQSGALVPLSVVAVVPAVREFSIQHKDLLPVVYVTGDMAGDADSPLYGLFDIKARLESEGGPEQWMLSQPDNPYDYSIKWDGEWRVTYDTFRDMGIAYSVGLVLIYLLVVAQFVLPGAAGDHGADPIDRDRHPAAGTRSSRR